MLREYHSFAKAGTEYTPQWMKMPNLASRNHSGLPGTERASPSWRGRELRHGGRSFGADLGDLMRDIARLSPAAAGTEQPMGDAARGETQSGNGDSYAGVHGETIAERDGMKHCGLCGAGVRSGATMGASPGFRAGDADTAYLVGIFAGDGAVKVIETAIVIDDRGLVGEGLIDSAGSAGVDQDLRDP